MTVEHTEFEVMGTHDFGEIILPSPQILVILPRRLVPYVVVATATPHNARHIGRLREHGRELGRDLIDQGYRLRAGLNEMSFPARENWKSFTAVGLKVLVNLIEKLLLGWLQSSASVGKGTSPHCCVS